MTPNQKLRPTEIQLSATEPIFYSKLYRLPVEILSRTSAILQHSNKDLPAFIMQILLQFFRSKWRERKGTLLYVKYVGK